MTNFYKLRWKNLYSYGKNWNEFDFQLGINKLSGSTGSGKSSIIEIIYWSLFGKCYRNVNLSGIINKINKKEAEAELYFSINNDYYLIQRGMKPNYLKVYKSTTYNDITDVKNIIPIPPNCKTYQEIIEEEILHISPILFEQISYKSMTRNSTFFTLKKPEKREVIEPILNIQFYTEMNLLAKTKVDTLEKEIEIIKKDLQYNNILVTQEKENLENLEKINKERELKSAIKKDELNIQITELQDKNNKNKIAIEKIQKYKIKKTELKNNQQTLNSEINNINEKINQIQVILTTQKNIKEQQEKRIQFLRKTCGTCSKIKLFEDEMNVEPDNSKLLDEHNQLKESIQQHNISIKEIESRINKCQEYINMELSIQTQIDSNNTHIANYKKQIIQEKEETINIDVTKLRTLEAKLRTLEADYNSKCSLKKHLLFARSLLTEEKIKAYVIKKYLPSINTFFSLYLQKFESEYQIQINSEFEEEFTTRHCENYKYENCSEGEKRKIDLAVIMTWIQFCRLKYQYANNNLLILDEVGSGLDINLQTLYYQIVKDFAKEYNKCIMFITHNNVDQQFIDYEYNIEKKGGFSVIEKIN